MDIGNALDGIGSAAKKLIKGAEPLLFLGGFVGGVTEAESNQGKYSGQPLATMISARLADTLSHIGISGVPTGNGQTSGTVAFKFNPLGFINRFAGLAALGWVYKSAGLPYHTEVYDVLWPFGVGGAIGGLFDPMVPASAQGQYSPTMTTYTPSPAMNYTQTGGFDHVLTPYGAEVYTSAIG